MNFKNSVVLLLGIILAVSITSVSASPMSVYNDPYSGYVLCVNKSTKVVTYPAKLKCPSGFRKLELGAQGADGAPGPAGVSMVKWAQSASIDIVADGYIDNSTNMVRRVLLHIDNTSFNMGNVLYTASIVGNWSDSAYEGDLIQCYFQSPNDYISNSGNSYWGGAEDEFQNWNTIRLSVKSSAIPSSLKVYLVCRTSGSVKGLRAYVEAVPADGIGSLAVLPIP